MDYLEFFDFVEDGIERHFNERFNAFEVYEEDEFRQRYRLNKSTVMELISEIENDNEVLSTCNTAISLTSPVCFTVLWKRFISES